MIKNTTIAIYLAFAFLSTALQAQTEPNTTVDLGVMQNQLTDHPSPYLALHGTDPVMWQDWSEDVLQRAKRENKLILISSGYFSCHWCHVMQAESYKNSDVATVLNNGFIPVKVDRELEPALDKRLMEYAQATLKRGGWPLNVFMSPDGIPVFAVLYQPQPEFLGLLNKLTGLWVNQSERIRALALKEKKLISFADAEPKIDADLSNEIRNLGVASILNRGDDIEGGFGQSNKFPSAPQLDFLLDSLTYSRNPQVIDFLEITLDAMANQGMRDHLSGGFYRYVVDPSWEIPHFEKMLYDNANLSRLYLKAGNVLDNAHYTEIAKDTLNFMMTDMASPNGAIYASFSAVDDQDIEGGYYLWQTEQLKQALNADEYLAFSQMWDTERSADLEAGNHLRDAKSIQAVATALNKNEEAIKRQLNAAKIKLLAARSKRILPTDDKLLAGWNAQALSAFSLAAIDLNSEAYRAQAQKIRDFIVNTLWNDQQLTRSLAKGTKIGSAAIEDYAYVARGLFDWAKLNGQSNDYELVEAVLNSAWARFHQNNAWLYADTSILPPNDGVEILPDDASASPSAIIIGTTIALYNENKLKDAMLYSGALSALNRDEGTLRSSAYWYASQIGVMQKVHN